MLTIPQLSYSTPTLAKTMRACMLCAGLSRASGNRAFVLGNPRAWLGTAYHEVLRAIRCLKFENLNLDEGSVRANSNKVGDFESNVNLSTLSILKHQTALTRFRS